ncbi:MAG TPA: hypothetical protein VID48_14190 [Solirubrobacteraceae bacterium]|jgi:hypothetical protein
MANTPPVLRIRNEYELHDLIDAEGRDATLIERDFALTVIVAGLIAEYERRPLLQGWIRPAPPLRP